eukprot:12986226-Alexandrium_andersonii.AAC.1
MPLPATAAFRSTGLMHSPCERCSALARMHSRTAAQPSSPWRASVCRCSLLKHRYEGQPSRAALSTCARTFARLPSNHWSVLLPAAPASSSIGVMCGPCSRSSAP